MDAKLFQVVEVETNETKEFETARDVSLFLSGCSFLLFKVFKNGKEVILNNLNAKNLKNHLQTF